MRSLPRRLVGPVQVVVLMLAVAAVVAACGGGGSASGPPTTEVPSPPPPPPPPDCVQTVIGCLTQTQYESELEDIEVTHNIQEDFERQWGLASMRAGRAYAQLELEHGIGLEPGSGQTVGLIDTGIDQDHPVFAGKMVTEQFLGGVQDETGDESWSHGTAVASVIAARRGVRLGNNRASAARGVASGADIAMFAIPTGSGGGPYNPVELTDQSSVDQIWADRLEQILNWSSAGRTLDFINVSVGYLGIIDQYSEQELAQQFPRFDRADRAGRRDRQDRLRLGSRQRPQRPMRCGRLPEPPGSLRGWARQRQVGRTLSWHACAHSRIEGEPHRRRGCRSR